VPIARLPETGTCGRCKQPLPAIAEPIEADEALFTEVMRDARIPVLVDFWAAWCGPCRMAAPEVATVARELAGQALVLKVNTEEQQGLAQRFQIRGIPSFMVIKNGRVVFQQAGLVRAAEMKRWLQASATQPHA